jgi:hypothetical protein
MFFYAPGSYASLGDIYVKYLSGIEFGQTLFEALDQRHPSTII